MWLFFFSKKKRERNIFNNFRNNKRLQRELLSENFWRKNFHNIAKETQKKSKGEKQKSLTEVSNAYQLVEWPTSRRYCFPEVFKRIKFALMSREIFLWNLLKDKKVLNFYQFSLLTSLFLWSPSNVFETLTFIHKTYFFRRASECTIGHLVLLFSVHFSRFLLVIIKFSLSSKFYLTITGRILHKKVVLRKKRYR